MSLNNTQSAFRLLADKLRDRASDIEIEVGSNATSGALNIVADEIDEVVHELGL